MPALEPVAVEVTFTGVGALIMHSERTLNPTDPLVQEIRKISSKHASKKTLEDYDQLARLEFEAGMYWLPEVGPYIPAPNLLACIRDGGKSNKKGKAMVSAFFIADEIVPLEYKGPRDVEGLWNVGGKDHIGGHVFLKGVKVGQAKVLRCRPRFHDWSLSFEASYDPTVLDFSDIEQAVEIAGRMRGLGDFRPQYGRFNGTVKKL